MPSMGMKAVGVYLETLREGKGLSRPWVASKAGTNDTSVYRVERRGQEAGPKILIGMVLAVGGSFRDINELLADDDLPSEIGRQLAEFRLKMGENKVSEIGQKLASDPDYIRIIRRIALEDDE